MSVRMLAVAVALLLVPLWANAQEGSLAPLNPEFERYLSDLSQGRVQETAADGHGLGGLPDPIDLPQNAGLALFPDTPMPQFDARYDLREHGKGTLVQDQQTCGSCWTFGSLASLESCLLPAETWNFSENNMKNTHGFDWTCCEGGNRTISTAYLARWGGPILEVDDPYNQSSCSSPSGLTVRKHLQQAIYIPDRTGPTDNTNFKQAVVTYGGVCTYFYWDDNYFNDTTDAFYYPSSANTNHAVCIIGWDDNYSRYNFRNTPAGNGAWIVKNSWGTWWGASGYFYVSYYDAVFPKASVVYTDSQPTTNYDRVYQYDPLGWCLSYGYSATTAWFANIFTAAATEDLVAVSWYAASVNSTYDLYIYTNAASGPRTGTLAATKSGTIAQPGYTTIALTTPLTVTAGQKFSVVVRQTTPGFSYPIPIESPVANFSSGAKASSGQSYVSYSGSSWTDLVNAEPNSNVCIKAFTKAPVPAEIQTSVDSVTVPEGGTATFGVKLSKAPASTVSVSVSRLSGDTDITVQSGATLSFGPSDYGTFKTVTLAAAQDADTTNGAAVIRCSASGWTSRDVSAAEQDDDAPVSLKIADVKGLADGASVTCADKTVSSVFGSQFYIQESDRSCGIMVQMSGHTALAGDKVTVSGAMATDAHGERCIAATAVSKLGTAPVKPLAITNRALGGGAFRGQCAVWDWQVQTDCYSPVGGLNNIGLFVRTCGLVTDSGEGYFYIDDGTCADDTSGTRGVLVGCSEDTPPKGVFAQVNGASSCLRVGDNPYRLLRAPGSADIYLPTGAAISGTVMEMGYDYTDTVVESVHPYANNYNHTWTITGPADAAYLCVYFTQVQLESGCDYLYVMDANDDIYEVWDNDAAKYGVWSAWVPGSVLKLMLTTDVSIQRYGFKVETYCAYVPLTPVEGVTVFLSPASQTAVTDADGRYVFKDLPTGDYTVTPAGPYWFDPTYRTTSVEFGHYVTNADFGAEQ